VSRIDEIRKVITGEREFPPSGKLLHLKMVAAEEGSTTIEMPIREEILNRGGGVQGGFLASLADANMGTSLATLCEDDESHSTIELKLSYLKPALAIAGPLTATARVLHRGRRIAHVEGDIRNASGELVAKATSTWAIRKSDGSPLPDRK
jgi:uncharacterized protein (TIGR00369 family)